MSILRDCNHSKNTADDEKEYIVTIDVDIRICSKSS